MVKRTGFVGDVLHGGFRTNEKKMRALAACPLFDNLLKRRMEWRIEITL
jgi:hypothetical protein